MCTSRDVALCLLGTTGGPANKCRAEASRGHLSESHYMKGLIQNLKTQKIQHPFREKTRVNLQILKL